MTAPQEGLADRLLRLGHVGLFQDPSGEELQALWEEPGTRRGLERLVADVDAPSRARFLAAEILFDRGWEVLGGRQSEELARVYATALKENYTGTGSAWALPGVSVGFTGEHLEGLGAPAVEPLAGLLDEPRRVRFQGSQEATLGEMHAYRVKDLAAFFIARIRDVSLDLDPDPSVRDRQIQELRASLDAGGGSS